MRVLVNDHGKGMITEISAAYYRDRVYLGKQQVKDPSYAYTSGLVMDLPDHNRFVVPELSVEESEKAVRALLQKGFADLTMYETPVAADPTRFW